MTRRLFPCGPTDARYVLASLGTFEGIADYGRFQSTYDEQEQCAVYWLEGGRTEVELLDTVVRRTLERVVSRHAVVMAPESVRRASCS